MFKSNSKGCFSRIIIAVFIQILVLSVFTGRAEAANPDSINSACDKLLGYYNRVENCNAWEVLGMRWATVECGRKYSPENAASASDYARNIMGAIAGRQDAAVINASIAELGAMQNTDGSFVNGDNTSLNQSIWAVIALDFARVNGFAVDYQRDDAISFICSCQDAGGGFDESGWGVDVDSTTHALMALAADYQQPGKDAITATINNALLYLHEQQLASGGFGSWGTESPDSIAAVIEALTALGLDPHADEWIKDGNNMVDALLSYQSQQGWFVYSWEPSGWNDPTVPNRMSTYHALLALEDLVRGQSKYHALLPDTNGVCFTLQSADSFNLDNDASMNYVISNTANHPVPVLVLAGLYDTACEQQLIVTSLSKTLQASESADFNSAFTIPARGSYEVRVFVWDNWNDKNPLVRPSVIPVH